MTPIPVVCDSCKRLWVTESLFGVAEGGTASVSMENVSVSPCPHCGGTGQVPDGLYELQSNATRYLGALKANELRTLLDVVQDAQRHTLDADIVAARIEHEVPSASPIADLVKNSGTGGLAAWLTLLVALIGLLLPLVQHQDKPLSQQQMEQAFVRALEQVQDEYAKP